MTLKARHCSQHHSAGESHYRSAPVSIHPVAENTQTQRRQQSAEQRPSRGQPPLKHPAYGRAHERRDNQLPDPGMPQPFAQRQHQPLRRRVHRHVGRLLDDMETLEVHRHGMWRIGHPAVCEGVGCQQITEFVMPAGSGIPRTGIRAARGSQHQQTDNDNAQRSSSRQPRKPSLNRAERPRFSSVVWHDAKQNQSQCGEHQDQFDDLE